MRKSRSLSAVIANLILVAGSIIIWLAFAPVKVGGQASYVIVNGISMEPGFHGGDLVIIRKAADYQIGDVTTYRDAKMGAFVIHRIIGTEPGHFILKGDNNSWIDDYHPADDEMVGKLWIHVPKLGNAMQWLHSPINLSLTVFLVGGVFMTGMIVQPSDRKKGKHSASPNMGGMLEGVLYLLGFVFLAFLGLSIFAFTRPLTRAANNISYQQESNYFYSATGTPGVYDTEMVRSGEPVFPKLTCFLNIGFTYNLLGDQFEGTSGTHEMIARVMDEQSGWNRTIPLIPQSAFTGNSYFTMATLDLCQVENLVTTMEKETGLRANAYTLEIVTNMAFTSNVAGQMVADTFNPSILFKFDKVHLYLADHGPQFDPFHMSQPGEASSSELQENSLPLLGWEPTVRSLRGMALLGLALSLGGLGVVGLYVFKTARHSQEALIRLRYGALLMDVYERSLDTTLPVIDVASIDDLAKLAERQNTMIMHMTLNFRHYYLVQSNGALYRSVINSRQQGIPGTRPARQEVFGYVVSNDEYELGASVPAQSEISGYVLSEPSSNFGNNQYTETEILRKIKI